jgi:hypothetical protein
MYKITDYTKRKAEMLGFEVRPSTLKNKKVDVFVNGKRIGSIGQLGMSDYPTYLKTHGKEYADERRRLYYLRHKKDTINEKLAKLLLW